MNSRWTTTFILIQKMINQQYRRVQLWAIGISSEPLQQTVPYFCGGLLKMECHKLRMSDLQLYAALEMVGEGAVGGWGGTPCCCGCWMLGEKGEKKKTKKDVNQLWCSQHQQPKLYETKHIFSSFFSPSASFNLSSQRKWQRKQKWVMFIFLIQVYLSNTQISDFENLILRDK